VTRDFQREVANWKEHLWEPVKFAKRERARIRCIQLYDKPSGCDMEDLDDVLAKAFVDASEVAA
jgi:hypothetical protein